MSTCEPVVDIATIVELFPSVHKHSVYRWNRATPGGKGLRLPAPDLVVGSSRLWTVESILSWADVHGLSVDSGTLDAVLKSQTT
jgi:hypothetical protein